MLKWWFKRHPELYTEIRRQLAGNRNYQQKVTLRNNLVVSQGDILVRYNGSTHRFPVLIVYPDSTPYALPFVYMLDDQKPLPESLAERISHAEFGGVGPLIEPFVKFYYHRHQSPGGSLCILEGDRLDGGADYFSTQAVLSRVMQWCRGQLTGQMPPEGNEVELYAHFPNQNDLEEFLYPEEFLEDVGQQGEFCGSLIASVPYGQEKHRTYIGAQLVALSSTGLVVHARSKTPQATLPPELTGATAYFSNRKVLLAKTEQEDLVAGLWFEVSEEPHPFANLEDLVRLIGNGKPETGYERFLKSVDFFRNYLNSLPEWFYVGIRYPNRRNTKEWGLFKLLKKKNAFSLLTINTVDDVRDALGNYPQLEAVRTEPFTEEAFHLRNRGRAERSRLKLTTAAVLGCGALGGEIADSLAKAGLGHLRLLDNQVFRAHNAVRHVLGIQAIGLPKAMALKHELEYHNPFVGVTASWEDVMQQSPFGGPPLSVAISSIADDNVEAYVNETALAEGQVVFYSRALRGGKAARVLRVIPGQDACFNCLNLYQQDGHPDFPAIPPDEALPTLVNECNNPVRPASAADLKLVAALTARLVLDFLQREHPSDDNHWVWTTEALPLQPSLPNGVPFALRASRLAPHPSCQFCCPVPIQAISLPEEGVAVMQHEISLSPAVETGGILVGRMINGCAEVMAVSGPGPNAIKKATLFQKDTAYCQEFLDAYEGTYFYLGEWHYHPSLDGTPSETDLTSLSAIAAQKEYLTTYPISIILTKNKKLWGSVHTKNGYSEASVAVKAH